MKRTAAGLRRIMVVASMLLAMFVLMAGSRGAYAQQAEMLVRISEIEIDSAYLKEYQHILKEEAAASVRLEPGVICIFPTFEKDNPTQVRILEIYANREAYESHIKSMQFQRYKTTTLKMVKSLRLVDIDAMDAKTMARIFVKMNSHP
jgi:quinol monooxygenase YgiN